MKEHESYKDSDIPWLKSLPSHWATKRAKYLFSLLDRPVEAHYEVITCFRDGVVTLRKNRRQTGFTESLTETGYQGINAGDLVIHQMDAFAGSVGVSDSDGKSTPVYSVCSPKEELSTYYYAYIIREMARTNYILSLAKGIRQRSTDFRFPTFARCLLPVPPVEEQNAIVAYLDKKCAEIDKLVSRRQSIIERLKELKQSIIADAVTKGLNQDVPMKDSGSEWIGDTPEKWQIVRFSRLVKCKIAGAWGDEAKDAEGDILCIRIADFDFDHFIFDDSGDLTRRNYNNEKITKLSLKQGDILVEKSGGGAKTPVGRAIIFDKEYPALYSNFIEKLILSDGVVAKWFLFVWNAFYFTGRIRHFIKQTTGIQNLDINTMLRSTVVPMPPYHEQNAIVAYLDKKCAEIDELVARQEQIIEKLKELKTSTIAHVVTGKVDVRDVI